MAHEVFISYAKPDRNVADAVCARLESRGIRCWYAPRNVLAGAQWGAEIIDALEAARVMVIVFSSHSNQSTYVRSEVERAVTKGLHVIPFRIEDVPPSKAIELFLSSPHWLDAFSPPIERHIEQLADTIDVVLGRRAPALAEAAAAVHAVPPPRQPLHAPPPPPPAAPPVPPEAPPPSRVRPLVVAAAVLFVIASGFGTYMAVSGPSAADVTELFAEVDGLDAQARQIPSVAHDAVRKELAVAIAARDRAKSDQQRGDRATACTELATARDHFTNGLSLDALARRASDARVAADARASSVTWVKHRAVDERYAAGRQARDEGDAKFRAADFDAARTSFESAASQYGAAARVNGEVDAAKRAQGAFQDAFGVVLWSDVVKPIRDGVARLKESDGRAAAAYERGDFAACVRGWDDATKACADLRTLDAKASELVTTLRRRVATPHAGAWYVPVRPEVEQVRADLQRVAGLCDDASKWDEAAAILREIEVRAAGLEQRHGAAAKAAREALATLTAVPRKLAERFPAEAGAYETVRGAAEEANADADFDAVATIVAQARTARAELDRKDQDDPGRAAAQARIGELGRALSALPNPLYKGLQARAAAVRGATAAAMRALAESDFAGVETTVAAALAEIGTLADQHAKARDRAVESQTAWSAHQRALAPGVTLPAAATDAAGRAEAAFLLADYDAVGSNYANARGLADAVVATWERTKQLQPGTTWTGTQGTPGGHYKWYSVRVTINARDGDALTATLAVGEMGRPANEEIQAAAKLTGAHMRLEVSKDQGGRWRGVWIDVDVDGKRLTGSMHSMPGGTSNIELTRP